MYRLQHTTLGNLFNVISFPKYDAYIEAKEKILYLYIYHIFLALCSIASKNNIDT